MKICNVPVTSWRGLRTGLGATAMLIAPLAVLDAPAWATNNSVAQAKLYDTNGNQVGSATLTQQGQGNVEIRISTNDLPPGFHGFHVHAVGECTPPFTSAGGHFDLGENTHRNHTGDLPVLQVKANGEGVEKIHTDRFSIADLFDADGSSLVIHANPDNYANIPTRYVAEPDAMTLAAGDSGDRIACGVIEKPAER